MGFISTWHLLPMVMFQLPVPSAAWQLSKPPGNCDWQSKPPIEHQAAKQSPGLKQKKLEEKDEEDVLAGAHWPAV
jgi:hypothetical protein